MKKKTDLQKNLLKLKKDLVKRLKKAKRRDFMMAAVIVGLLASLYYFRGQFIVAIVNGQPISRLALIRELEKQGGAATIDTLVTKSLIMQEARKQKVTVTDEEIEQEIRNIELTLLQQGQDLQMVLGARGMDKESLKGDIEIQKVVEKIVSKDVQVTDEEIEQYFEQRKDTFPEDLSTEEVRENIREQLLQQKLSEATQIWIQSLHDKGKIQYLLMKPQVENF